METLVVTVRIPHSTCHAWVAYELDRGDHNDDGSMIRIGDLRYRPVFDRLPHHPRFADRAADGMDIIFKEIPALKDVQAGIIRDSAAGVVVY